MAMLTKRMRGRNPNRPRAQFEGSDTPPPNTQPPGAASGPRSTLTLADRPAEGSDHLAEIVAVVQDAKVRVALHPLDVLPPLRRWPGAARRRTARRIAAPPRGRRPRRPPGAPRPTRCRGPACRPGRRRADRLLSRAIRSPMATARSSDSRPAAGFPCFPSTLPIPRWTDASVMRLPRSSARDRRTTSAWSRARPKQSRPSPSASRSTRNWPSS